MYGNRYPEINKPELGATDTTVHLGFPRSYYLGNEVIVGVVAK